MKQKHEQQEKLDIISWVVKEDDESAIGRIKELIDDIEYERKSDAKVIGFGVNGAKLFKSQFILSIRQSERGIKSGEFLTVDELEKQSENW